MKKLVLFLLVFFLSFSLVACGEKENSTTEILETVETKKTGGAEISKFELSKDVFAENEPITFDIEYTLGEHSSAWVGIVPAGTVHNDEYAANEVRVDYFSLAIIEKHEFYPIEKGEYELRVYSDDDGGEELGSIPFEVK